MKFMKANEEEKRKRNSFQIPNFQKTKERINYNDNSIQELN